VKYNIKFSLVTRIANLTIFFFLKDASYHMEQYIIYNKEYGMTICKPCGHAIKSDWMKRYLLEKHKDLEIRLRKELVEYIKGLNLRPQPSRVQ